MKQTTTGFTIVELLIVIVIIAILTTITIVAYNGIQNRANDAAILSDINGNAKALEQYSVLNGTYPTDQTTFKAAGLKFSKSAYGVAMYCEKGGNDYALVIQSKSGRAWSYRPADGTVVYTGVFDTANAICGRVGVASQDVAAWLHGTVTWSWVD